VTAPPQGRNALLFDKDDEVMTPQVIYIDQSLVKRGKLKELRRRLLSLVRLVKKEVAGAYTYSVYLSPDSRHLTVVHVHRSAQSLARHLQVAGAMFPHFRPLITLRRIDVFGRVGRPVAQKLEAKAALLGGSVQFHGRVAGFTRTSPGAARRRPRRARRKA
jgi:quinol monooxygenase YgiN